MLVVVGEMTFSENLRNQRLNDAYHDRLHLILKGIEKDSIVLVQYYKEKYHHTYRAAIAFRDWLLKSNVTPRFVDVYTVGVHSRKSYIIFKRVLSPNYQVGILSGRPLYYSPKRWFLSKKGFYLVNKNFFGFLYGKLFPFQLVASNGNE